MIELRECTARKTWNEAGQLIEDFQIDSSSDAFTRLDHAQRTEDNRVRWFYQKYGKPPESNAR
jgi:hypothetical protein